MQKPLIQLSADEVHIWFKFHSDLGDTIHRQRCCDVVTADEFARASQCYFERDRFQSLLTRTFLRTTLSRYAPLPPRAWLFEVDSYGRPEIAAAQKYMSHGLRFNLTHTRGLVALAVARNRKVGVDAEALSRSVRPDVAHRLFSRDEVRALRALPSQAQADRFLALWTLKESYLKARGLGLRVPLDQISFSLHPARHIGLHIDSSLGDTAESWKLWQLKPGPDHVVAVCVERKTSTHAIRLVCRSAIGSDDDQWMAAPVSAFTHNDEFLTTANDSPILLSEFADGRDMFRHSQNLENEATFE